MLERAVKLLKDMDEFAQSRFRLEARYRHVLVDEFQDTSRAQWQLVAQLVRNWGEGFGAAADAIAPSIFIVGDRKQSIYGFRDADVSVLDEAAGFVVGLRAQGDPAAGHFGQLSLRCRRFCVRQRRVRRRREGAGARRPVSLRGDRPISAATRDRPRPV